MLTRSVASLLEGCRVLLLEGVTTLRSGQIDWGVIQVGIARCLHCSVTALPWILSYCLARALP